MSTRARIARQLDLFAPPPAAQTSEMFGLRVSLPDACRCGSHEAQIGEGKGPHVAAYFCARCGAHRGWMPAETHRFITETVSQFGNPSAPINIRRSKQKQNS